MESFNYTTAEGDRLDILAHRFYGTNAGISVIVDANPMVPITAVFPIGTVLIIPIIDDDRQVTDKTNLPPWKQ